MDPDLNCLIRLHDTIQKVKNSNGENTVKINELRQLFEQLNENIQNVFKEQSTSMGTTMEKKKEDAKNKKWWLGLKNLINIWNYICSK